MYNSLCKRLFLVGLMILVGFQVLNFQIQNIFWSFNISRCQVKVDKNDCEKMQHEMSELEAE